MRPASGSRPRVALATSADWPQLESDDVVLAPALAAAGVDAEIAIWTDDRVDWRRYDAVVIRSCWDYHDDVARWLRFVDGVETLAAKGVGPRLMNPPSVLRWNARKTYLRELGASGVPVVPTWFFETRELDSWHAFEHALESAPWAELVVKPAVSAGARHTHRLRGDDRAAWRAAFEGERDAWIARGPLLVEPYLPEIADEGEWSLLYFGGAFSHAVLKTPAAGDFRVQERHGGTTRVAVPSPSLSSVAARTLDAAAAVTGLGARAALPYARVDLVVVAGQPLLVELEVTEPALFLAEDPAAPARFAAAVAGGLPPR